MILKKYKLLKDKFVVGATIDISQYDNTEYIRCPFCNSKIMEKFFLKAIEMPPHCPNCGGKLNCIDTSTQKLKGGKLGWQI